MKFFIPLSVASTALAAFTSDQEYPPIASFKEPNACVPTGYFQAQDLGTTTESKVKATCRAQCTKYGSQCNAYVAQLQTAPNGLSTGQCYYYTTPPSGPQYCANYPTKIIGETKDPVVACLETDPSVTAFCSSYLGIATKTTFTSSTTPVVTSTIATTTTLSTTTTVPMFKRALSTASCLRSQPASRISSACSDLSIQPKTTAKVYTASALTTTVTITTTSSAIATVSNLVRNPGFDNSQTDLSPWTVGPGGSAFQLDSTPGQFISSPNSASCDFQPRCALTQQLIPSPLQDVTYNFTVQIGQLASGASLALYCQYEYKSTGGSENNASVYCNTVGPCQIQCNFGGPNSQFGNSPGPYGIQINSNFLPSSSSSGQGIWIDNVSFVLA